VTRSLRSWLWRIPIEQEVEEELAFHVEMRRRDGRPLSDEDIAQVRRACLETARKRDREMKLTQRHFEIVGRTFQASDEAGNNNVVVLGESLWRSLFAGNPDIVGRDVTLNGQPYTVVGVVRDNTQLARQARMWTMLAPLVNVPPPLRQLPSFGRDRTARA
jgi:hypothetical protein